MNVHVTELEREILLQLVSRELDATGPEIRHTRTSAYRDDLKEYKRHLRTLLRQLYAIEAPTE